MYSYHNYKKNRQKQRIFTLVNKLTDVDTESSDDKYLQKLEKSDNDEEKSEESSLHTTASSSTESFSTPEKSLPVTATALSSVESSVIVEKSLSATATDPPSTEFSGKSEDPSSIASIEIFVEPPSPILKSESVPPSTTGPKVLKFLINKKNKKETPLSRPN